MRPGKPDWVLVLEYIETASKPVTSAEISKDLGIGDRQVSGALVRLHAEGRIDKLYKRGGRARWGVRRLNL